MPLSPGDKAPPFAVRNQHGEVVRSTDLEGSRYVLYFYPRDQTPVCTREACAFQEGIETFRALGVPVLGVSADSVSSHARFAKRNGLAFSLLSDPDRQMIAAFDARGLLGRTSRITYIVGPQGDVEAVHRAELSGRGHVAWAEAELARLGAPAV